MSFDFLQDWLPNTIKGTIVDNAVRIETKVQGTIYTTIIEKPKKGMLLLS